MKGTWSHLYNWHYCLPLAYNWRGHVAHWRHDGRERAYCGQAGTVWKPVPEVSPNPCNLRVCKRCLRMMKEEAKEMTDVQFRTSMKVEGAHALAIGDPHE